MNVGKIADKNYYTVEADSTVFDAIKLMNEKRVYGLIVVDKDKTPIGMVSERSLLRKFMQRNQRPDEVQIRTIMRTPIPKVPSTFDVKDVAAFLAKNSLTRCAVFEGDKLLGIVTITDLSRYLSVESVYNVLFSHKTKQYDLICPKCKNGTLMPVYNDKHEITVFKCNNPDCDYVE